MAELQYHLFDHWAEQTREAIRQWIADQGPREADYLFPSRVHGCPHVLSHCLYNQQVNDRTRWPPVL
jgi:hypothetical protein